MISLAKFSVRRPVAALVGWLVVAAALIAVGLGVANQMSPSVTVVSGTESARAQALANQHFGPSQLVPILLEGPKAQLDAVGPKLVVALTKRPHTRALSAWDAGVASTGLRPSANAAMIVVSVDQTEAHAVKYDQPQIEKLVRQQLGSAPVKAYITGQPSIDRSLRDAAINDLRTHELIAVGVVFFLLLLGLRAPLAALIVTIKAAVSMLAAFGEVALLAHFMKLDAVGVAAGSMTGLAIGVGFGLLILDRFHREQLADGRAPADYANAAMVQLESTGRAVLIGGTGLVIALGLVAIIGPTELMVSVGTAALTSAAFATGAAVVVMPAALVLLGRHIDAFSFPAPRFAQSLWDGLVGGGSWVTRYAVFTGAAATAILGAIAVPAFALNTGQPSVKELPKNSPARIAFQEVSKVMGAGWATPYNMVIVSNNLPITTPAMLASIDTLQRQIASNKKTVVSVTGPGQINSQALQLKKFGPSLVNSAKVSKQSKKDLLKLIDGLGQAGAGSSKLRAGLVTAVSGANQLHGGSGQAQAGSVALHNGLIQASTGSVQLSNGLNQALSGANALKNGAAQALSGAQQLNNGLGQAAGPVKAGLPAVASLAADSLTAYNGIKAVSGQATSAASQASSALARLQAMGAAAKSDPNYAAAVSALTNAASAASSAKNGASSAASTAGTAAFLAAGTKSQVNQLAPGLQQLHAGAGQLAAGIQQLASGNSQLASGISQLANGGGQLRNGLGQLTSGAGQLEAGLALLDAGTGQLAVGLQPAPTGAGQIASGLGIMQKAVTKARGQIPSTKDLETLMKQSPGMFSSGYFILAAVEGARGSDRNAATFTLNLARGGTAGQIMVVSRYESNDPRSTALQKQLVALGKTFATKNHVSVAVGGPGGAISDLTSATTSKIWVDVVVLALALTLVLALALRAIVLPAAAVLFNLLVVGSAFGVIQILFGGSNPPLGGPGYLDPVTVISIFTVAFGVSMIYTTILLMRTREFYVVDGHNGNAVLEGLRYTAAPATGGAIVMVGAMVPFATTNLINVRELGVGVGVALLLNALLLRPVLLPAAAKVLGRLGWWPTQGRRSGPEEPAEPGRRARPARTPRLHLPHRGPRPAHQ